MWSKLKIRVIAYGRIRVYLQNKIGERACTKTEIEFEIGDRSTVKDLFSLLNKPQMEVWMANVNGRVVGEAWRLSEGDLVRIFEPLGGG